MKRLFHILAWVGFAASLIVLTIVVAAIATFGPLRSAVAFAQGNTVLVANPQIDLGALYPGETYTATFDVRNVTPQRISILGAQTSCGCLATEVPVELGVNERRDLVFAVSVSPGHPVAPLEHQIEIIDSYRGSGTLLTISGQVRPTGPGAG